MRFSAVKYEKDETFYYNPKTFHRDENLIIFPFNEFDSFYNELVQNLNVAKTIINNTLNSNSPHLQTDLYQLEDWINLISENVALLLKFEMQTTLNSFQCSDSAKIKPPLKTLPMENKLSHSKKSQYLIEHTDESRYKKDKVI